VTIVVDAPVRRSRGRRLPVASIVAPVVGVGVVLTIWAIGGRAGWASGMVVTPAEAIRPIIGSSRDVYARATAATVWSAFRGLLIGSAIAFVAALVAATVPPLRRAISRLAAVANAAPWVAVAPCLLVILGRDRGPVAVAAIAVFFFVFVSTSIGLGSAPPAAHDVLTALGSSRRVRVLSVQLPACWPSVVDGLKLGAPAAMAGAIFGEWYGAPRGLGVLLLSAMQSGRAERLWAASLISAACGLLAFGLLAALRAALVPRYGAVITQSQTVAEFAKGGSRVRTAVIELATVAVLVVGMVAAWWIWIDAADISPLVVPRPSRVWRDIAGSLSEYARATGSTLATAGFAFLLGAFVGIAAAVAASRIRLFAGAVVPVIVVLAATPIVALFPLMARVFGNEPSTVRILAATMVFFPVFVYTRSGLTAASRSAADVVTALGASTNKRFSLLTVPAAVPHIVSGCRIAAGSSVIAAVVGETLIGSVGLGVQFSYEYRLLHMPPAFGAAIAIVVVSVAVFAASGSIERAVHARWS